MNCIGHVRVVQSLNIQGSGRVVLDDEYSLGVFPSPYIYSGECYIEARYPSSEVKSGSNVYINNNAIMIADK